MKILILGDSLTFGHGVNLENTWPYLLQKKGCWVTHRGRGGSTIIKVLEELNEIEDWRKKKRKNNNFYPFDICIIQAGIVDSTPRPFSRNISFLLSKMYITNLILLKLGKSRFFLRYFGKPWISENIFLKNLKLLKKKVNNFAKKTIYLEIAMPAHHLIDNCGNFSERVKKYNKILKENNDKKFLFLPIYGDQLSDKYILKDGYHLNQSGHNLIFKNIIKRINI
jgi:lysophospholipase L1-like esterase